MSIVFDEAAEATNVKLRQQIAADAHVGSSGNRLADRKKVKRKLAELEVRKQRRAELERAIAGVDRELDAAVEAHQKQAAPIQSKLKKVERDLADALVAGGPAEVLERQRQNARSELDAANLELQAASRKADERRELLQRELDLPELSTAAKSILESELIRLGDPALLDEHFAAQDAIDWRLRQHAAAVEKLRNAERGIAANRGEEKTMYERRARRWAAAERAASAALAEAKRAEAEIIQKIVSE